MPTCPECGSEVTETGTAASRQDRHARMALRALHELREAVRGQFGDLLGEELDELKRRLRDIVILIREWRSH